MSAGLLSINSRGDKTILDQGYRCLRREAGCLSPEWCHIWMYSLRDEDSLTERFDKKTDGLIDIAVIRYPRISNFTDFNVFEQMPEVTVRYVSTVK